MKVLVLGASGASGQRVLDQALARGHQVTAFARDPAKVSLEHPRLGRVAGDVTVASTLHAAVPGHDAVVWTVGGHDRLREPRRAAAPGVCTLGTRHLLDAMADAGVRRLVCQSSWGAGDSRTRAPLPYRAAIFPLLLGAELADKTEQERLVRLSGIDWTVVRPARLTDGPATGRYRTGPALRFNWRAHVPRADIAKLILDELERAVHIGEIVEVSA